MISIPDNAPAALRERALWLDRQIREGNYPNYRAMMQRFGVRKRSVTKVLAFMRDDLGLPIGYSRARGGYQYVGEPPPLTPPPAGERELAALSLTLSLARRHLDAGTVGDLSALQDRLLRDAGPRLRREQAARRSHVVFTGPPPLGARWLDRLHAAIDGRRVLVIDYRAPRRGVVVREIEPHFLVNAAGDWLLVAWDRSRTAPRTFATTRIAYIEETSATFEPRAELDAGTFTRYQFLSEGGKRPYDLVVRFSPAAAPLARERRWHPTQQLDDLPGGGCEVRLTIGGEGDALRWVLGFGAEVEVIGPDWMRRRVTRVVEQLLRKYGPGGQGDKDIPAGAPNGVADDPSRQVG
jgi:predicted DNA-binding transcriptional regulator YafY